MLFYVYSKRKKKLSQRQENKYNILLYNRLLFFFAACNSYGIVKIVCKFLIPHEYLSDLENSETNENRMFLRAVNGQNLVSRSCQTLTCWQLS